jgi:hypothetical protein
MRGLILASCLIIIPSLASAQVSLSIHCTDWLSAVNNYQSDAAGIKNQKIFDACTKKINKNKNDPCQLQPAPYGTLVTTTQQQSLINDVSTQLMYSGALLQLLGQLPAPNAMSDAAATLLNSPDGILGAYGTEISNICTQNPSMPLAYVTAEAFAIVETTYEELMPPSGEFLMNAVTQWLGPIP